jgi:limonene-1,2-epoxide hydrolase
MTKSTHAVKRREFLQVAGIGTMAGFVLPASAQGADVSDSEKANVKLVNDFCGAWATRDLIKILPFLSDDCVYRMSETTPPVTGHAGVTERLGSWLETSQRVEFNVLETFAKGPIVINHRVDRFSSTTRPLTWEGVGVFFVKDGKIREWSDYSIRTTR